MNAYQIGKFYSVPCVKSQWQWMPTVPILGPMHEDREIIDFPEHHYHIDWRFVSARAWQRRLSASPGKGKSNGHKVLGLPISERNICSDVFMHRLLCKREMPEFPLSAWLTELEPLYASRRLTEDFVCPHRGIPLAGCPVKNGVVICPGHGLAWNVETRKLVPRQSKLCVNDTQE